jgi:hypothetical protein
VAESSLKGKKSINIGENNKNKHKNTVFCYNKIIIIKKLELMIKNDHQIRDQHHRIRGFMQK